MWFGEHDPALHNVLIIAPLSRHYATLLRGTVKEFLDGKHNVFITNWRCASKVPLSDGLFTPDIYINDVIEDIEYFDGDAHVVAICQSGVPAIAAISLLAQNHQQTPKSLTIMGAPIDTRISPTMVNEFAGKYDLDWFKENVISTVSYGNLGAGRAVYPGFLQLTGFIMMNPDQHRHAYDSYRENIAAGNEDKAHQHEVFYDEYLSVLDSETDFA